MTNISKWVIVGIEAAAIAGVMAIVGVKGWVSLGLFIASAAIIRGFNWAVEKAFQPMFSPEILTTWAFGAIGLIGGYFVLSERVRKQGEELNDKIDRKEFEIGMKMLDEKIGWVHSDLTDIKNLLTAAVGRFLGTLDKQLVKCYITCRYNQQLT